MKHLVLPFPLDGIAGAAMSEDRQRLVVSSLYEEGVVCFYDSPFEPGSASTARKQTLPSEIVARIAMSPNGRSFVTPHESGAVCWDWDGNELFQVDGVSVVAFLDNSRIFGVRTSGQPEALLVDFAPNRGPIVTELTPLGDCGKDYDIVLPATPLGIAVNELAPPQYSRTNWVDVQNSTRAQAENEAVLAVSPLGRSIAVSTGPRAFAVRDLSSGHVYDLRKVDQTLAATLVEDCVYLDESALVVRTDGHGFVVVSVLPNGKVEMVDWSAKVRAALSTNENPYSTTPLTGSWVAMRSGDATVIVDLAEVCRGGE
jgi:WD40 repeat protein